MEIKITVNGITRHYDYSIPMICSDEESVDWIFSELEQSEPDYYNRLKHYNMGKLIEFKPLRKTFKQRLKEKQNEKEKNN